MFLYQSEYSVFYYPYASLGAEQTPLLKAAGIVVGGAAAVLGVFGSPLTPVAVGIAALMIGKENNHGKWTQEDISHLRSCGERKTGQGIVGLRVGARILSK